MIEIFLNELLILHFNCFECIQKIPLLVVAVSHSFVIVAPEVYFLEFFLVNAVVSFHEPSVSHFFGLF